MKLSQNSLHANGSGKHAIREVRVVTFSLLRLGGNTRTLKTPFSLLLVLATLHASTHWAYEVRGPLHRKQKVFARHCPMTATLKTACKRVAFGV
jgi:hypothetical protein